MRKILALLISVLFITGTVFTASAETTVNTFSIDAVDTYCEAWEKEYAQNDPLLNCGYFLTDNNKYVDSLYITYNLENSTVEYKSELIPSTACLYFTYDVTENLFGVCVFANNMDSDLEKVTFYTDEGVIKDVATVNDHDPQYSYDMWSMYLEGDKMLELFGTEAFTLRWTVSGKTEVIDITYKEDKYLFEMVKWLMAAQLYADVNYDEFYLNPKYLPEDIPAVTTAPDNSEGKYSFQDDYEKIEEVAKSLFYVEIYDKDGEAVGNASGFVCFDEHLFVTNQHVIDGASYLKVWDEDDNVYIISQVVASDAKTDIAILRFPAGKNYNALAVNAEEELKRGQPVVTIGSPEGFQNTVAYGNISAFPKIDDLKYIQFTAPASHGSSGGCLFDNSGKVIGITSAGYEEGQNLNFAIPIKLVVELYEQWDKVSFESLGTEKSWDMASYGTGKKAPIPSTAIVGTWELIDAKSGANSGEDFTGIIAEIKELGGEITLTFTDDRMTLYMNAWGETDSSEAKYEYRNGKLILDTDVTMDAVIEGDILTLSLEGDSLTFRKTK